MLQKMLLEIVFYLHLLQNKLLHASVEVHLNVSNGE